ncbi:hypothetical protein L249_0900 [Ophiocordyceps polyrhachis-furcata BCC 54312]|uniref:Nudix hydrolase domain-containing protein n=1 Tax=Ophiocordyceps polyrhachis-furcata BCC 54312 TaxID=1330021 RepID=A0A367LCQ9_9HYPO|nr:hypothetical protein L249_0900 [Ophiocordyceps polyrhachis-furcata BCC 54312]
MARSLSHRLLARYAHGSKMASDGVRIDLPEGLTQGQLQSFRPFKNWMTTLNKSLERQKAASHPFHADPYALRSVTVQSFDRFGGDRLGFVKLAATVSNSAGESLPGAALLRGPSVAVLVMLIPDDDSSGDERYVVMTMQPRIPVGSMAFAELPAGMVDDAGSLKGAAAKEMEEELGITIKDDELTCLSDMAADDGGEEKFDDDEGLAAAMYPSAGGCDEHVTLYSLERRIPRQQLRDWTGRLTGLRDEGERITLKLVPMKKLWREGARDAKALGALALWEALRREGRL